MRVVRVVRQQWIGVLGVFIGLTGVAIGAAGQPALLGRVNTANQPTTLRNTATGPAVSFDVKAGQPPFAVNSSKLVRKLNAAQLGGHGPNAFARAGSSHTKAEADARFIDTAEVGDYYSKAQVEGKFVDTTEIGGYYTKAQADGKFIDTAEIGGYYTKAQVNAGFAPAEGSTAYLASGVRILEATTQTHVEISSSIPVPTSTFAYDRTFTAPADGTISFTVTGTCFSQHGSLAVRAKDGEQGETIALPSAAFGLCDVTALASVSAGEVFTPSAVLSTALAFTQASLGAWSATVVFVPD